MRQMFSQRFLLVGLSVLSGMWLWSQVQHAQAVPNAPTVTVLSPQGAAADVVGEGDDYFTQVQHNPRDMNDKEDLTWQVFGISNLSYANGIWSGTTSNVGPANYPPPNYSSVYLVYPGYSHNPTGGANDDSVAEIGKTGWNYPINANKYKTLSFRLKAPASAANSWWHAGYTNYSFTKEISHAEGFYPTVGADTWQVYTLTMPQNGSKPWTGTMYGLEYRFGLGLGTYQFDWVRLTDLTTSPVYTVTFSVSGAQAGDVVDLDCYLTASATADQYCGPIARGLSTGSTSYLWRTAYLPPDDYYVKATVRNGSTALATDVSNGALTIQGVPLLTIDSPSMTSGPDYATTELGNPWDMSDSSDIFTSSDLYRFPHDIQAPCPCFANGEMFGTAGRFDPQDEQFTGDPFAYLRVSRSVPIDTAKYKYLTYRFKVDQVPWWSDSGARLRPDPSRGNVYPAAWLTRLIFFNSWPLDAGSHSNTSNDIVIFDDWNTYQMDLSQGVARGYWEPQAAQAGGYWTGFKTAFRFDMLEGVDPWVFHLDDVKLTGDDTANASYQVKWSVFSDAQLKTIDFYRSTSRSNCLTSGVKFYTWSAGGDTQPPPPPPGPYRIYLPLILMSDNGGGNGSYVWDTSGVPPGTYAICARASDGFNTSTTVSDAYVVISH